MPAACDEADFVSQNCSREIKGASKKLKLSYWITLDDNVPTFNGQFQLTFRYKSSYRTYDLRICWEIAEEKKELKERT